MTDIESRVSALESQVAYLSAFHEPEPPDGLVLDAPTDGTDATDTINAQIAAVPAGATLVVPPGRYYTPRTIRIADHPGLTMEAAGAVFWSDMKPLAGIKETDIATIARHFDILRSTDVTIRGLTVEGANTEEGDKPGYAVYDGERENEHAFSIHESTNIAIEDGTSTAIFGDGVYIGGAFYDASHNVTITDHVVSNNGRQGMAVTKATNVTITNPAIVNSRRSGIDLEPNKELEGVEVDGVTIEGGTFNTWLLAIPSGGYGQVNNVTVRGVTVERSGVPWLSVNATNEAIRSGWLIEDNIVQVNGSPAEAIRLFWMDDVVVRNNHLTFGAPARLMTAVRTRGGTGNVSIVDNCFDGAAAIVKAEDPDGNEIPFPGVEVNNLLSGCP